MKKLLLMLLGVLMALPAAAAATLIDGLYYNLNDADHTAAVTYRYSNNSNSGYVSGDLVIPEKVHYNEVEYTVTSIGSSAFLECSSLTSIEIPNSVTSIGGYAFQNCTKLTSIEIPNSITSIGSSAFSGCQIETLSIDTQNISNWFRGISTLKNLTIGNSVISIGSSAFQNCTKLTSIEIPNSVISIDDYAFNGCSGLTNVTIGNSVNSIGKYAFERCSGLTSINIPNSVISIGAWAFQYCSRLTSVDIPNSVTEIGYDAFKGSPIETLSIDVQNIPNWFSGISTLKNLTIGNSVTSIGENAFNGCSGLTSVTIGNSVNSIGSSAFQGCSGLTSVDIPNSVTEIGRSAFYNCKGLTSMVIPKSVNSIGNSAFYQCSALNKLIFADCEEPIKLGYDVYTNSGTGRGLFYYCPLEYLYVGRDISYSAGQYYGYSPFRDIKTLTNIEFGNLVTTISSYAFYNCNGLTSVVIPNRVQTIGNYAFYGCYGLTSIQIGNSVTSIGQYAFYSCKGLTSVVIPNRVQTIGDYAFNNCSALKSVIIGNSVQSIGNNTFPILEEIVVLSKDIAIAVSKSNRIVSPANSNKTVNSSYITYSDEAVFSPDYRYLYEGDKLIFASVMLDKLNIPASVNHVIERAVVESDNLKTIRIECSNNVLNISSDISVNKNVSELYLGRNIKYDWDGPFLSSLANLTIGENVTTIPEHCFDGTQGLANVVSEANSAPQIYSDTFEGSYNTANLTIPTGCAPSYINPNNWWHRFASLNISEGTHLTADFELDGLAYRMVGEPEDYQVEVIRSESYSGLTEVVIPDVVLVKKGGNTGGVLIPTSDSNSEDAEISLDSQLDAGFSVLSYTVVGIAPNAFSGFTNIKTLQTPSTLRYIGNMAFRNCTGLESAKLNDEIKIIDGCAFQGCSALSEIGLPSALEEIGPCAFYGCAKFESLTFGNNIVSIGESAFSDCTDLSTIDFGQGSGASIGNYAFMNCPNITDVALGNDYVSVGDYAFYVEKSSKMKSITLGQNLRTIGAHAFENSTSRSLLIPEECKLQSIGDYAFYYAQRITSDIVLPSTLENIGEYAFSYLRTPSVSFPANEKLSIGKYAFNTCQYLEKVDFAGKIKSIGDYAFSKCDNLNQDLIVECVEGIGDYAFEDCSALSSAEIVASYIGDYAFTGCSSITTAEVMADNVGQYAFNKNSSLTFASIKGEGRLDNYAFTQCPSIDSITIDMSIIGGYIMEQSRNVTKIDLRGRVKTIETRGFTGSNSITCEVLFGDKLEYIGQYGFYSRKMEKLEFPSAKEKNPVIQVAGSAFLGNNLREIHLGNRMKSLAGNNLPNSIDILDMGSSIESLEGNFPNYVKEAYIPASIRRIQYSNPDSKTIKKLVLEESRAAINFVSNKMPTSVTRHIAVDTLITGRPISADQVGTLNMANAFTISKALIYTDTPGHEMDLTDASFLHGSTPYLYVGSCVKTISHLPSADYAVFNEGLETFTANFSVIGNETIVLPRSLKTLSTGLINAKKLIFLDAEEELDLIGCSGSSKLEEVYIGRNLKDNGVSLKSSKLVKAIIGNNETNYVSRVPSNLFKDCTSLEHAILSDNITSIGESAFSGCSALKILSLPANILSIGDLAFEGCNNMSRIVSRTLTPDDIEGKIAFGREVEQNVPLYVPDEVVDVYEDSDLFWSFSTIKSFSEGVANSVVVEDVAELDDAKPGDEIDLMMLANPQRVLVGAEPRSAAPRRAKAADDVFDSFYWFSPNPEIATITEDGVLTVLKDEPAEIWCYALDGSDQKAVIGINQFILGDLNSDRVVNLLDLERMIDHITSPAGSTIKLKAADMNGDGEINLLDIERLIDYIVKE